MKNMISKKLAGIILLSALSFLFLFHLLVIFKILPSDIVWAGQTDSANFIKLELFALALTLLFILVALGKTGYFKSRVFAKISNGLIWVMLVYFSLNILGNLMSPNIVEKIIFTPFSLILVLSCIRLVFKD